MTVKKTISVFTPAYNEEDGIRACYDEVRRVMEGLSGRYEYEHIIADNCSTDGTLAVLRELAAEDPRLKVLVNSRNFGAEKSAFNALSFTTGDAVVGISVDLQEPPALIPQMVGLWEEGNEIIYGVYKNPHEGLLMRGGRRVYYWLVDKLSSEHLPRDFMGFALMSRRVVDEVTAIEDYAPYIRGIIATVGFKQLPLPYQRGARTTGRTKHGFAFLLDFGINGLISHSLVPIRAATVTGAVLFSISLLATLAVILIKIFAPWLQAPGVTTIVTLVMFFSGVQLLFLGLLGEYIGAIHSQVRRKPFVIVRESINFDRTLARAQELPGASARKLRRSRIRRLQRVKKA